jgi:hypothetical protein
MAWVCELDTRASPSLATMAYVDEEKVVIARNQNSSAKVYCGVEA